MKFCGGCGTEKPRGAFSKDKRAGDGLASQCKECRNARRAAYYRANGERLKAYSADWRAANREYAAERDSAYYRANRERITKRERERYRANRERITEQQAKYRASNPDVFWRARYRTRMKKFGFHVATVEDFTYDDVIERYGATCWHCPEGEFEELDHYPIPVSQAGPHSLENVRPSCADCNRQTWREEVAA